MPQGHDVVLVDTAGRMQASAELCGSHILNMAIHQHHTGDGLGLYITMQYRAMRHRIGA